MEHYQSTCTPQPSISKFPPITPTVTLDYGARPEETCLPPELSVNCCHGSKVYNCFPLCLLCSCLSPLVGPYASFLNLVQLGFCAEASFHLQEMKDRLISISNDLLDNSSDMNPDQIEKLRQDRFALCSILSIYFHSSRRARFI